MTEEKGDDSLIMEVLEEAFPGRSPQKVAPIGLVYAGVRWGRDFRFGLLPKDETGKPILARECSGEKYRQYLSWLADYLYELEAEPIDEQKGLCKYMSEMQAEDAVSLIGMNAALYEYDAEDMEDAIEEGKPFSVYWEEVQEYIRELDLEEEEEYDEDTLRDMFYTVKREMQTKQRYRSDIPYADAGYRLVLSVVLKKLENPEERIDLLDRFYKSYNVYASK